MNLMRFASDMRLALYQCGQVALSLQGKVAREEKEPDSIHQTSTSVSAVDRICQEILLLAAHDSAPGLEAQSEEMEDCPEGISAIYAHSHHRYALILDPVDGTGDYLSGNDSYAHMLGLLDQESSRMALGMIYFPVAARLYVGLRGMGVFHAAGYWGMLEPVQPCAAPRTAEDGKRVTDRDRATMQELGYVLVKPQSASAAYEHTRVVLGDLGAMVMRHFHGHDTAITSVLIEELGGAVLAEHGKVVRYDREMGRMPLVVSSLNADYALELATRLT